MRNLKLQKNRDKEIGMAFAVSTSGGRNENEDFGVVAAWRNFHVRGSSLFYRRRRGWLLSLRRILRCGPASPAPGVLCSCARLSGARIRLLVDRRLLLSSGRSLGVACRLLGSPALCWRGLDWSAILWRPLLRWILAAPVRQLPAISCQLLADRSSLSRRWALRK